MTGLTEALARHVRAVVARPVATDRDRTGWSPGGDPQLGIDARAEAATRQFLRDAGVTVLLRTEDHQLEQIGTGTPDRLLLVDPVDGTRPAAAGIDAACVCVAEAPPDLDATIGDVRAATVCELAGGATLTVDERGLRATGYRRPVPALRRTTAIGELTWSTELNGHPAALVAEACGELIDRSANTGAVFVFNSASFSITRIVTGQLDAYVDIGNRILRDRPATRAAFLAAGNGSILHLFPYDLAAPVAIAEAAGVVVTDGYGRSLHDVGLVDASEGAQRSAVAAATPELHDAILAALHVPAEGGVPCAP